MDNNIIEKNPQELSRDYFSRIFINCDYICNNSICEYCQVKLFNIPFKRYFLPLIGVVGILIIEDLHSFIYLPIVIFVVSLILFWNFPILIIFMKTKPLYYEELYLVNASPAIVEIEQNMKEKFEYIFNTSLIITNSLLTAGLGDYWLYQSSNRGSYIEMIGITGGIIKIFQSLNYFTGTIILYAIRKQIEKELDKQPDKGVSIELTNISHTIHTDCEENPEETKEENLEENLEENTEDNIKDNIEINIKEPINDNKPTILFHDDVIIIHTPREKSKKNTLSKEDVLSNSIIGILDSETIIVNKPDII
tara:strand:- start:5583 stop:6506 length:924 start_codon:yes stop_codon:yes gene_type:complete